MATFMLTEAISKRNLAECLHVLLTLPGSITAAGLVPQGLYRRPPRTTGATVGLAALLLHLHYTVFYVTLISAHSLLQPHPSRLLC